MDRWLLGLVAGLVGGAGGALAVHYLVPKEAPPVAVAPSRADVGGAAVPGREGTGAATLEARPEDSLAARLDRIEHLLRERQGRAEAGVDPATLAVMRQAVGE